MREFLAIARKEWQAAFGTPLGWNLLAAYSFMSGLIFLGLLQSFLDAQERVRELPGGWAQLPDELLVFRSLTHGVFANFWAALLVVILFIVPFLAMRSFAEERRRGTLYQLLATPLRPSTIVLGKFLGLGLVLLALLSTSLVFLVLIRLFGGAEARLDLAPILLGWATTVLWGLTNLAIGIFLSALVRAPTTAAFLGVTVSLSWLLVKSLAPSGKGQALLEALSFEGLLTPLISGTLDPRPIAILVSIAGCFLLFATIAVEGARRG